MQKGNSVSLLAAITLGSLFIIGCMLLFFIRRTCHPKRGELNVSAALTDDTFVQKLVYLKTPVCCSSRSMCL